mmetsp:Transcript_83316/g.147560  ORF Transcript_83316/g.147560 Transcript_83316/m.147560 type:complete len:223 (+) Transcript_83316:30-698(+)
MSWLSIAIGTNTCRSTFKKFGNDTCNHLASHQASYTLGFRSMDARLFAGGSSVSGISHEAVTFHVPDIRLEEENPSPSTFSRNLGIMPSSISAYGIGVPGVYSWLLPRTANHHASAVTPSPKSSTKNTESERIRLGKSDISLLNASKDTVAVLCNFSASLTQRSLNSAQALSRSLDSQAVHLLAERARAFSSFCFCDTIFVNESANDMFFSRWYPGQIVGCM